MFRIDDRYPGELVRPSLEKPLETDLEEAWYSWRPKGLFAEIQIGEYRLMVVGLSYVELVRFCVLGLAEGLTDCRPMYKAEQKIASQLSLDGFVYFLRIGEQEHMYNPPLIAFQIYNREKVYIHTRTYRRKSGSPSFKLEILQGRDLTAPVITTRTQVIDELCQFLKRHLAYYRSIFPEIQNSEMYLGMSSRLSALSPDSEGRSRD